MKWLHRWIGLVFGVWLTLMGLSGALIVFYPEIDTALNPALVRADHADASPDIDAMRRVLTQAYPDRAILSFERYGLSARESYPFVLSGKTPITDAAAPRRPSLEVFVEPHTHAILGQRGYWTWFRVLRSFHMELFAPETGERIVGALGVVLLVTVVLGGVLWWRESRRRLGHALRPRWSAPAPILLRDIHTVGGVYAALFIALQGLSGALVADLYPVTSLVARLTQGETRAFPKSPPIPARGMISANAARDAALARHPNSDVTQMVFPAPGFSFYSVRLFPTDQPRHPFMRQILVDPASAKIVHAFDPSTQGVAQRLFGLWMIWIHDAQIFGVVGRAILVATGTMLTLLFPTGVYLWLRRRKLRREP